MARRSRRRSRHFRTGGGGLSIKRCGFFCHFDRRILKSPDECHGNPTDTGSLVAFFEVSSEEFGMQACCAWHIGFRNACHGMIPLAFGRIDVDPVICCVAPSKWRSARLCALTVGILTNSAGSRGRERYCPEVQEAGMARERERHHQRNSRSASSGSGFRRCVRAAFSGRRYGLTSWGNSSGQFRSGLSCASARRIEAVAGTDCRAVVGCSAPGKTG